MHYSPDDVRLPKRVREKILPSPDEFQGSPCWIWTGCFSKGGYGRIGVGGKLDYSHRLTFELLRGDIEENLCVDHLCKNRICCNPAHMEVVTRGENVKRGDTGKHNSIKTHCPHGHKYTPKNTVIRKGNRECKTCVNYRNTKEYRTRNREV